MKCLILLTLFVFSQCEVKEEDGVLVVTTDNWSEVVTDDSTVLVEFCKFFLPDLLIKELSLHISL